MFSDYVANTLLPDGLAPLGIKTFAYDMMIMFGPVVVFAVF